ncbi:MAG: tyrosine-protein kinase domain-containing protein [Paludibacteraceae bacterium]
MNNVDFDFHFLFKLLFKYWLILLIGCILGSLFGIIFSKWIFKPEYESSVTAYAWQSNSGSDEISSVKYQDIEVSSRLVNDYKEIITSFRVQDEVFNQIKQKFPDVQNSDYKINTMLLRNTRILKIVASSSNPQLAQFAANATASAFEIVVQNVMQHKNIKIIDPARLPQKPVSPRQPLNVAVGLIAGLFLALLTVSVKELLDWTIKVPEEALERLGKNVIGTIPENEDTDNGKKHKGKFGHPNKQSRIFIDEKDSSAIVEAFKILRTNIEFSIPGKQKSKIIMFTSTLPNEGKTTIVSNLALSMCESGKKVVLLDCDLRKPFLHKFFQVDNSKGIVSILVGKASLEDSINKNLLGKGLDLIVSGPIPPSPTELLMSDAYKQLLDELSKNYDYVFIDAPPTLNMADTAIIGRLVDATMLVITAGKTRIELIKRCIRQLHQSNIEVSGILLNRFNPGGVKFGYYHYHYHYSDLKQGEQYAVAAK